MNRMILFANCCNVLLLEKGANIKDKWNGVVQRSELVICVNMVWC